jgi:hypothetical protein
MLTLAIDPETVFQKVPDAKAEFLSWAMSDQDFLESFVELLATGCSTELSWPSNLNRLRERFHEVTGEDYLADALRRVQDYEQEAENARASERRMDYRLKTAIKLFPDIANHIRHNQAVDAQDCPACRFLRVLKGED